MVEAVDQYYKHVRGDVFDIAPEPAGHVLDLGGGVGATGAARRGATFVVVADLVARDTADGVDVAVSGNLDPTFLRKLLEDYGPFDTILRLDVLEHLRNPWLTLADLHKGLVLNGVVAASILNVNCHRLVMSPVLRGQYELQEVVLLDRKRLWWFQGQRGGDDDEVGAEARNRRRISWHEKRPAQCAQLGLLDRFMITQYLVRDR